MAKTYVVTGPLALVKNEDGSTAYLYRGAPIPPHVTGDELQNLVDSGLVGSQDELAAQPPEGTQVPEPPKGEKKS